jgi:O-acetyl-ADP-ribose deacetylase (regulator of RNase III)
MMKAKINKISIQLQQISLLASSAACIVHVTDTNLNLSPELHAAGAVVEKATSEIGWCEIGEAVITEAGALPYEKIIHAVAPRWGEGSERARLANLTLRCLQLADLHRLKSLAFPPISTGILGYPLENCAKTMIEQIIDFTFENPRYVRLIQVCLTSPTHFSAFCSELHQQINDLLARGEGEVQM